MATYSLPELPYDYGALEPHISGRIMELHHSKHHNTYVNGANTALEKLAAAREAGDFGNINQLSKDLAFNLGGHTNHSIFWNNLSPEGGDKPTGELAAAIDEYFGSFDNFQAQFTAAALGIQGSGWSHLAIDQSVATWSSNSSGPTKRCPSSYHSTVHAGYVRHAFYLDYQNVKPDYVKAIWNIVNWADVQKRFEAARAGASQIVTPN